MNGNSAVAEAAVRAGCRYFFGYPITPQNELPEHMCKRLPDVGGVFVQAESETSAINMVFGAAGAGARVMTSSSSPGISLKMEGISYLSGARLPCVVVNMMRGGPGLGGIHAAQGDYFQATKGGGHGDYRMVVLAPASVQEAVDLTREAFDIADRYRVVVMILADGLLGQMMEPVAFEEDAPRDPPAKPWATTGALDRAPNVVKSFDLDPYKLEEHVGELYDSYAEIASSETRWELEASGDAEWFVVAYGTASRIARSAVEAARQEGLPVGLIRPISLWPFPGEAFETVMDRAKGFLTVEMSRGQMVEDVRLAVNGRRPAHFYGRSSGVLPEEEAIVGELRRLGGDSW